MSSLIARTKWLSECRIAGIAAILAIFVAILFASAVTAQNRAPNLSDTDIAAAVETELFTNEGVSSHLIDVSVSEGVVTLSGTVNNILAKDKAEDIAQAIKGVRSVINQIEVKPTKRSDKEVAADVVAALATDPATDSYQVEVDVKNGTVDLSGSVDSWAEKRLIEVVTKGVRGVRQVDNNLAVKIDGKRPDKDIRAEIKRRMEVDALIDDELIEVNVDDGEVSLTGTVGSASEKARARLAAFVKGVEEVDATGLKVEWWARDKIRRDPVVLDDEQIEEAVEDALVYDPRVKWFKPEVEVRDGLVTLTGTVGDLAARRAAEETAKNTIGVWRVRNLLRVRPEKLPADNEITDRVQNALARDPYVERYQIEVDTVNGLVYLSGTVDSAFERNQAEMIAENVGGVVDVNNNLLISDVAGPYKSDWEIREDIQDQLWWSPFVDADKITVMVNEGVATLTGTVEDWSEYRAATRNAWEGGAAVVRNRLNVRGSGAGLLY